MIIKQDGKDKFWCKNDLVGYLDDNKIYGINPITGYRVEIEDAERTPKESLEKWLRFFSK